MRHVNPKYGSDPDVAMPDLNWWRARDAQAAAHEIDRLVESVDRGYSGPWPEGDSDLDVLLEQGILPGRKKARSRKKHGA